MYRDKLGLGHLTSVPARNGSCAQVQWTVGSKLECRVLMEVLDAHPLRGRKRAEYEIWREAVALWASTGYGLGPGVQVRLAQMAAYIKAERVYREPRAGTRVTDMTDRYAANYFAGFFSGEGCFGLPRRGARFVIKLRRDDRPLLEAFRHGFAIGSVIDVAAAKSWSPGAVWHVTGARDVLAGIALFESAPLLGRKARQYEGWRPGAQAVAHAILERAPLDDAVVEDARRALTSATAYQPPRTPLELDDGSLAARAAYLQVLRDWADSADGQLACSRYAAVRRHLHPYWPTRNTITAAFGSWYDALRCAGLEHRAARRS